MITHPSQTLPHTIPNNIEGSMTPVEHLLDFKTFASLKRMVMHQQSKALIQHADFIKQILLFLPQVAPFFEESDFGIVHLEVGAMKLATRDAFARNDFAAIHKHLSLIANLFNRADAELYDALRISYLEALFLGETSAAHIVARSMLSRQMENVLREAELAQEKRRIAAGR